MSTTTTVHFDHEAGRILQSCGSGDELRSVTEAAEIDEWRNAQGTTLLRFGRIAAGSSGWPKSSMFSQPELEAILERRARELPAVEIRRGVELTTLDQIGDHVVVGDAAGGSVRGRYAGGCDGANSTVRDLAGITMADLGFFHDWLIVDVVLDQPRVFDPVNLQICDPARQRRTAAQRPQGHRSLHGARQGHLRPRPCRRRGP